MPMPTALTEEAAARAIQAASIGAPQRLIASHAGVARSTLNLWLAKGKEEPNSPEGRFRTRYMEALARSEMGLLAIWMKHAQTDYRAARDRLAVMHPESYAKTRRLRLEGVPPPAPPPADAAARAPMKVVVQIVQPKDPPASGGE